MSSSDCLSFSLCYVACPVCGACFKWRGLASHMSVHAGTRVRNKLVPAVAPLSYRQRLRRERLERSQ